MEVKRTLTRAELSEAITSEFNMSKLQASEFIETILKEIAVALYNGEMVKLTKFGTLYVRQKKQRIGRNPKTLQEAVITARKSISFRAATCLKSIINSNKD